MVNMVAGSIQTDQPIFKKRRRIPYFWLIWLSFTAIQIPWILDRFFWFLWPRQSFQLSFRTGGDREALKDGPWSVKFYDVAARFTGRFSIVTTNYLLFTMMHQTHQWLESNRFLNRFIDFSDETARLRVHKVLGISLAVFMLVHVWSILLPCVTHGFKAAVWAGYFVPILSEQTPDGFKDVNLDEWTMYLQVDDVYRLALMTSLLVPLMYLSFRKLIENYRFGIALHNFIAIMFWIDLVRRHSHPHCWVINIPVFFFYLVDKMILSQVLKKDKLVMSKLDISEDYTCFYWEATSDKMAGKDKSYISRIYNVRAALESFSPFERQHPFTTFQNRGGIFDESLEPSPQKFTKVSDCGKILELNDPTKIQISHQEPLVKTKKSFGDVNRNWTTAFICRVYHNDKSHTKLLRNEVDHGKPINIWGQGSALAVRDVLLGSKRPVTLIAGGSGLGYVLDVLSYVAPTANALRITSPSITLVLTTYDLDLFTWFLDCAKFSIQKMDPTTRSKLRFVVALTSGKNARHQIKQLSQELLQLNQQEGREILLGRIDFKEFFQERRNAQEGGKVKEHVFCHGGQALSDKVFNAAAKVGFEVHESITFS